MGLEKQSFSVGAEFSIELCSNPSTGFQWLNPVQISDEAVVRQTNHEFSLPSTDIPGDTGHEIWIFEAQNKGIVTISTQYSQPWEGGQKNEWTFVATIVVE
jgi:inhibitor of cysteine peptidase